MLFFQHFLLQLTFILLVVGSRESTGAHNRSTSCPRRVSVQKLAEMAGVPSASLSPRKKQLARTAQQYRHMAHEFRRKMVIARRKCSDLSKLVNQKFIDMVDELAISPITGKSLRVSLEMSKLSQMEGDGL